MRKQSVISKGDAILALSFGFSLLTAPRPVFAAKTIDAELAASLDKGYKEMAKGDYSKAIKILGDAVKKDSDSVTARRYLAYALVKAGMSMAAIDQLNAITKLVKPTYFEWCTYGEAYLRAGGLDQAASCYKAAIALAPKADYAKSGLIRVSLQSKNYEEAMNLAKDGMKEAPDQQIYDYYKKLYAGVLAASTQPQVTAGASAPVVQATNATGTAAPAEGVTQETLIKRISSQGSRPIENHPGG